MPIRAQAGRDQARRQAGAGGAGVVDDAREHGVEPGRGAEQGLIAPGVHSAVLTGRGRLLPVLPPASPISRVKAFRSLRLPLQYPARRTPGRSASRAPPPSAPPASRLPIGFSQGPHMTTPQATSAVPFLDRDLGWLEFNKRVLHEALDDRTPLLERLKFLAIFSSNLDEWFMKRAEGLREAQAGAAVSADGAAGVNRLARVREPILTPLKVDPSHPFPFISNLSTSLGILQRAPGASEPRFARVKIPPNVPAWLGLPVSEAAPGLCFVRMR